MRYAKLNGNRLDYYRGGSVRTDAGTVFNPSEATLLAAGYLPVPATRTDAPVTGWSVVDGALVPEYGDPYPAAPRTLSKLKVVVALTKMGKWADAKARLEANGLYDLFVMAQDFREDNEYFTQGLAALKDLLGVGDEAVEELLAACVAE